MANQKKHGRDDHIIIEWLNVIGKNETRTSISKFMKYTAKEVMCKRGDDDL